MAKFERDRHGSVGILAIIGILIAISIFAVFMPLFSEMRESARNAVYECQDGDYPVLTDTSWCTNETGIDYLLFNQSATPTGLNSSEYTMLGLMAVLIILALIAGVAYKVGILK